MARSTPAAPDELPTEPGASPPDDLGPRLRLLRRSRRLTLRDVADATGLSESFLSQVERGKADASVASLRRIAQTFGIGIHDLFDPAGQRGSRVLRHAERDVLRFGDRAEKWLLTPPPLLALEILVCEFAPGGSTGADAYTHGDSEEVFVVLEGRIELEVDGEVTVMEAGDSARYRSSLAHRAANVGTGTAKALYTMTPPTF